MSYSGGKEVRTENTKVYKIANFEFGSCDGFRRCLERKHLQIITETFLTGRCKQECKISFKHCNTGCMYFQSLEESLGFDEKYLSKSVCNIICCLYKIVESDKSLDAMKDGLHTFHTRLVDIGLLDISTIKVDYRDGPMNRFSTKSKFNPGSPVISKIVPPHLLLDSDKYYPINTTGKRGVCVIVNVYRDNSCRDVLPIQLLFEDLNYEVITFDNVKMNEFISSVTDHVYRRISDLKSDSFILILSSHGDEENIYFVDGKLNRESIIKYFLNDYCPYLAGKPKLFFFQNCRGKEGFFMEDLSNMESVMADAQLNHLKTRKISHVSDHQLDIARFYASTRGMAAYRDHNGTFFLQCLIEILKDPKKKRQSLNDIQPELCHKVYEKAQTLFKESDQIGGQIPQLETTLLKRYYFCHPHL